MDIVMRREENKLNELENLKVMIREGQFDWEQRYNSKYILDTAVEFGLNKSRFKKAVEEADKHERFIKNKLQQYKDKEAKNK